MRKLLATAILAVLPAGLVSLTAASAVYVATDAGAYKSTDDGATWQLISLPAAPGGIPLRGVTFQAHAVAVDPENPSNVYFFGDAVGAGLSIYRSNDAGQTWTLNPVSVPAMNPLITTLTVDPHSPDILYLAGSSGLFRSTDAGRTWDRAGLTAQVDGLATDPGTRGVVYATVAVSGGVRQVFKSTDSGATWALISPFILAQYAPGITVDPHDSKVLYLGLFGSCVPSGAIDAEACGIFKSSDGGINWIQLNSLGYFKNVVVDPRSGAIYAGGGVLSLTGHVVKSTDGGKTWSTQDAGLGTSSAFVQLDPDDSSRLYAIQASGYIFSSSPLPAAVFTGSDGGANWTLHRLSPPDTFPEAQLGVRGLAVAGSGQGSGGATGTRKFDMSPPRVSRADPAPSRRS